MCDLYKSFGPRVFKHWFQASRKLHTFKGCLISLYSNRELRSALSDVFGDLTLGSILEKGEYAVIPAFCLTTGRPRIFKTDHADGLSRHNQYSIGDIALASSAAPIYFPVVEVKTPDDARVERYCDGGIFANHPALLGLAEALYHLKRPLTEIKILSVSTPRSMVAEDFSAVGFVRRRVLRRGLFAWRRSLAGLFIDSTSDISDEALRRIFFAIGGSKSDYQRIVFPRPQGLDLDIATTNATHTLETMGVEKGSNREVRDQMEVFFKEVAKATYGQRSEIL